MRVIAPKGLGAVLIVLAALAIWPSTPAVFADDGDATTAPPVASVADAEQVDASLPPLPFSRASMDLPRLQRGENQDRVGEESGIPQVDQEQVEQVETVANPALILPDSAVDEARASGARWIEVILSEQKVVAWEGDQPVREFTVSTGLPGTETVRGTFRMWVRTRSQTMSGGSRASGTYYNLPNVEWVQYFYQEYALHGTYWHNNFGRPMSHGCVNLTNEDAEWLFKWAMPEWSGERGWLRTTEENATLVHVRS